MPSDGQLPEYKPLTDAERDNNRKVILASLTRFFTNEGVKNPCRAAAAFCGNIWIESRYNPLSTNKNSNAFGICQWLGSRLKTLKGFEDWSTLSGQIEYLKYELQNTELSTMKYLKELEGSESIEDITVAIRKKFERCKPSEAADAKRINGAKEAEQECSNL